MRRANVPSIHAYAPTPRVGVVLLCALAFLSCDSDSTVPEQDADAPARRPNILLLLADDLGNNDLGINNLSIDDNANDIETPNMDDFARSGTRFTRFYTESTCTPSRVALLTGRYAARAGFRPTGRGIPPHLTTLPEALRSQGYATHHVGKWHVGATVQSAWPLAQGFDSSFGFLNQWSMREPKGKRLFTYPTYHDPWLQRDNQPRQPFKGHLTDLLTDHTVELIETAEPSKPWFIYHAFFAPHTPIQPAERFAAMFPDTPTGKFKALLKQLDTSVGRILESLRKSGQLEDTIVVLASDNGGLNAARDNNAPYFGKKSTYWEGGVRVPLVIHWPKDFEPGTSVSDPVAIFDLYPTLLDLIESSDRPMDLDGVSLRRAQHQKELLSRNLFWESFVFNRSVYGVLTPDDARLYHELGGESHLLDLAENPHGDPARSVEDKARSRAMRERYEGWRSNTRKIALQWTPSSGRGHGALTGDDFQRSPGLAGFTFAIGVVPDTPASGEQPLQVIAYQRDLLAIALDRKGRVRVEVDGKVLESAPVVGGQCHSIVFSGFFNRRLSPRASRKARVSVLHLFVDGELVDLESSKRPLPSEAKLNAPTYIGSDSDGKHRFSGTLNRPVIFNQTLMPESSDSSPGVGDIHSELCPTDND